MERESAFRIFDRAVAIHSVLVNTSRANSSKRMVFGFEETGIRARGLAETNRQFTLGIL